MSDYDDSMNDYDWFQNTGELREYFEDDFPGDSHRSQPQYYQHGYSDGGSDAECLSIFLVIAFVISGIIALIVWLI